MQNVYPKIEQTFRKDSIKYFRAEAGDVIGIEEFNEQINSGLKPLHVLDNIPNLLSCRIPRKTLK